MDVSKVSKAVPNFEFEETKNSSFAGVSETPNSSRIQGVNDRELEPKDNFSEYRRNEDVQSEAT